MSEGGNMLPNLIYSPLTQYGPSLFVSLSLSLSLPPSISLSAQIHIQFLLIQSGSVSLARYNMLNVLDTDFQLPPPYPLPIVLSHTRILVQPSVPAEILRQEHPAFARQQLCHTLSLSLSLRLSTCLSIWLHHLRTQSKYAVRQE